MVRHDDAVDAAFDGEQRVVACDDAFDHQLHRRRIAETLDEVPRDVACLKGGHLRDVEIVIHRMPLRPAGDPRRVTRRACPCVGAPRSLERFAVRAALQIDRQHEHRAAGGLGPLDNRARDVPIVGRIELLPHRRASLGDDRLDGRGGERGQDLQMLLRARRFGHGDLSVRMERLLVADRREHDRTGPRGAEDPHAHVDVPHIDQAPDPQLKFRKALSVRPHRRVVVDTRGEIAEVRRRQLAAGDRLEVHDVDRLVGRRDQLVDLP